MSKAAAESLWRRLLLALALASGTSLAAEEFDLSGGVGAFGDREAEQSLLESISKIESSGGAYAAELPEQMLSLGLTLQEQNRHGEAIDVFKRGVHLTRINNGLYCREQIPLLQGEITSSVALGEYARADELQRYLYRVEVRGLASGKERAATLMQQASWQFSAYQLSLEPQGIERLSSMWELYRLALSDISSDEGDTSPLLLQPLYGLLRTQYLIAEYQPDGQEPGYGFNTAYADAGANRFYAYRSQNYEQGRSVILSIYKIQSSNKGEDSSEAIEALVTLGDWALWNDKRDQAIATYQLALTELAARDDAQEVEQRLFGEPVPLPDITELHQLPPAVDAGQGNLLVEFAVDSRGETKDMVRLDNNEDIDPAANRLLRVLRNTKFRPRFQAGQPVGTDKLVRAYDIEA